MTTLEQIEARDFTYVQVFWSEPPFHVEHFVVGSPFLAEAKLRAERVIPALFPGAGDPSEINYYPRTYVAKARKLFALGLHD